MCTVLSISLSNLESWPAPLSQRPASIRSLRLSRNFLNLCRRRVAAFRRRGTANLRSFRTRCQAFFTRASTFFCCERPLFREAATNRSPISQSTFSTSSPRSASFSGFEKTSDVKPHCLVHHLLYEDDLSITILIASTLHSNLTQLRFCRRQRVSHELKLSYLDRISGWGRQKPSPSAVQTSYFRCSLQSK